MRTSDGIIIAIIVAVMVFILYAAMLLVGSLIFMWAWNTLMPLLWTAAPKLAFVHALAASLLLGAIKGLFSFSQVVSKDRS